MRCSGQKQRKGIDEIWGRQRGEINPRAFARRLIASEEFVQRLENYAKLEKHNGCVNTVCFNSAGDTLISGSDDKTVILWDWDARREKLSFQSGHTNNVFQAKPMPFSDDSHLVTCGADGQVRFAQIREGGHVETMRLGRHRGRAHKLAVEPGSPHIFYTCGEDGLVQHFDLRTRSATKLFVCKKLHGPRSSRSIIHLNTIAINPRNPNLFAVAGSDELVRLYDMRHYMSDESSDEKLPCDLFCPGHLIGNEEVGITGLAFSNQGELLVSYIDELIYLFPSGSGLRSDVKSAGLQEDAEILHPQAYDGHLNADTVKGVNFFGPNCEYVVSGSDCGRMFIWKTKNSQLMRVIEADKYVVNCVESHPHAPVLASSGIEKDIKLWSPIANKSELPLPNIDEIKSRRRCRWSPFTTPTLDDLTFHLISQTMPDGQHDGDEEDNAESLEYVVSLTDALEEDEHSSDDGDLDDDDDDDDDDNPSDCRVS